MMIWPLRQPTTTSCWACWMFSRGLLAEVDANGRKHIDELRRDFSNTTTGRVTYLVRRLEDHTNAWVVSRDSQLTPLNQQQIYIADRVQTQGRSDADLERRVVELERRLLVAESVPLENASAYANNPEWDRGADPTKWRIDASSALSRDAEIVAIETGMRKVRTHQKT